MTHDWQQLKDLTKNETFSIKQVELTHSKIKIEGNFELPPLARLSTEDQAFIAAFIESHGSIREMEALFNISYPTVKSRLRKITDELQGFGLTVKTKTEDRQSILEKLESQEISVNEALEELKQCPR